jgi:hypothetical protein
MFQNKAIRVDIQIRNPRTRQGDVPVFLIEDWVEVAVRVMLEKGEINPRESVVAVGWHTEGKGNRDSEHFESKPLDLSRLAPGLPLQERFEFQLPRKPISYRGTLISVIWAVEVAIDLPLIRDVNASQPFIMVPSLDYV